MIRQYPAPHDPYEVSPIAKLWYGLLADCLKRSCERIHVLPSESPDLQRHSELSEHSDFLDDGEPPEDFGTFTIRAFVDGAWEEVTKPPGKMYPAFLQRLKVMANFSLARHLPTERGRFRFAMGDSVYDIAVTVRANPDGSQDAMIYLPSDPLQNAKPA